MKCPRCQYERRVWMAAHKYLRRARALVWCDAHRSRCMRAYIAGIRWRRRAPYGVTL